MTVLNPIDDRSPAWAGWFNAFANAHGAGGIISGCSISKGTGDWDIDVTSGQIFEANTEASISSGTVTITDSSALTSGQQRITLIHADTGDALASTDGSAAASGSVKTPDIPASEVLLGFVVVSDSDSTVADSDIFDIPALVQNDNVRLKDGGSHELDVADLAGGDGTDGQLPRSDGSATSWSDQSATGTYTGDGANSQSITGLGFQPNLVVICRDGSVGDIAMSIDDADNSWVSGDSATSSSKITSLDADGFTVSDGGADNDPNKNNETYRYFATR